MIGKAYSRLVLVSLAVAAVLVFPGTAVAWEVYARDTTIHIQRQSADTTLAAFSVWWRDSEIPTSAAADGSWVNFEYWTRHSLPTIQLESSNENAFEFDASHHPVWLVYSSTVRSTLLTLRPPLPVELTTSTAHALAAEIASASASASASVGIASIGAFDSSAINAIGTIGVFLVGAAAIALISPKWGG